MKGRPSRTPKSSYALSVHANLGKVRELTVVPSVYAGFSVTLSGVRNQDSRTHMMRIVQERSKPMAPTFISTVGVWGVLFISFMTPKMVRRIMPIISVW
jgi:hypothetical protein